MRSGEEMVGGVGWRVGSTADFARHHNMCRVWDPGGRPSLLGRAAVGGWNVRGLSDHRAKVLKLRCGKRRWRTTPPNETNARKENWERLKEEEKNGEFVRKTAELMEERGELGEGEVWKKLTGLMTREAEEVCGVVECQVMNPWMIGH